MSAFWHFYAKTHPKTLKKHSSGHSEAGAQNHSKGTPWGKGLTFWVRRPPRWGGGLPREGVVAEKFGPSLESLFSLGFGREESGMSREFCRDVPDPWGCPKTLCKKSSCAFFVPLDTFEKHRTHLPCLSRCFSKSVPSSWQKVVYHRGQ